MKAAIAQFEVARGNPEKNLQSIAAFAEKARASGADLLALPEMATTGFDWLRNVELLDQAEAQRAELAACAHKAGICLCGSFLEKTASGRPANTFLFFNRNGGIEARYRKAHLFTLFREDRHMEAGDSIVTADTSIGRIGCSVCYDLRFPELFRKCALEGAWLQLVPAAFPHPRSEHWRTMVRCRALENQGFLIAVNQCGREEHGDKVGTIHYCGNSMVVDPWGEVVFEAGQESGLFYVDIDAEMVEKVRSHLTALRDRRPELYSVGASL